MRLLRARVSRWVSRVKAAWAVYGGAVMLPPLNAYYKDTTIGDTHYVESRLITQLSDHFVACAAACTEAKNPEMAKGFIKAAETLDGSLHGFKRQS